MIRLHVVLPKYLRANNLRLKAITTLIIAWACGNSCLAQPNLVCSYNMYSNPAKVVTTCLDPYFLSEPGKFMITDAKESGAKDKFYMNDARDTVLIESLGPFLQELGFSRNFDVFRCDREQVSQTFVANTLHQWRYYRSIFAPPEATQIFTSPEGKLLAALSLFHAVGHQLLRHYFIGGITEQAMELEADRFSGFALARLSHNRQSVLQEIDNWNPQILELVEFPAFSKRKQAILLGWQQGIGAGAFPFEAEIPLYELDTERVSYFWERAKEADSLGDYEASARNYLNAYSYSGGKNRVVLDGAFEKAKMAGNPELAIKLGKEYLRGGMGAENLIGLKNLLLELSKLYQQATNPDEAMRYLELSRKGDDYRTADMFAESRMLFRMGRFEESREALTEAIRLGPATPEMYNLLGEVSLELGDVKGAIRSYRGVLAMHPGDVQAILGLASVYAREALSIAALEEQEKDRGEKARLVAAKTALFRQAEEVLRAGLAERPGDEQLLMQLLRVYVLIPDAKGTRDIKRALKDTQK